MLRYIPKNSKLKFVNSNNLKVALIPLEIKWEDKEFNLIAVEEKLSLVHPETDLVILPETFSTGFPSGEKSEHVRTFAEDNLGKTVSFLKSLSRKYNVAIAGSFIASDNDKLFNRGFFIEPSGDVYFSDKHHLFTMAKENEVFTKGNSRLSVRYRGWNIAMIICYDLRFPVWCRNINNEYDFLIAVANWPLARVDAWNKLLFARAIENQAYVCGVNCRGTDKKGFEYDGSTLAIDYKGKDITMALEETDIKYALLCRDKLDSFREKFPAWNDADTFTIYK